MPIVRIIGLKQEGGGGGGGIFLKFFFENVEGGVGANE